MLRNCILASALVLLAAAPSRAQEAESDPDQLVLRYTGQAGRRALTGVAHKLEWSVVSLQGGAVRVSLRVPLDAFESGDPGVDAKVQEALESARFPLVEVDGIAQTLALPVRFNGVVRLHGQTRPFAAVLSLARAGGQLAVSCSLALDLEAFGVARPWLDGAQLERNLEVEFSALLSIQPQAIASGGFVNSN